MKWLEVVRDDVTDEVSADKTRASRDEQPHAGFSSCWRIALKVFIVLVQLEQTPHLFVPHTGLRVWEDLSSTNSSLQIRHVTHILV